MADVKTRKDITNGYRMTVRVPETFHRQVKSVAAREGVSIAKLLVRLVNDHERRLALRPSPLHKGADD